MYIPAPFPHDSDAKALGRYLYAELLKISEAMNRMNVNSIQFDPHYTDDLVKVQDGLTAFFIPNGSQTKDGLYTYNNGAWQKNS